MSLGSGNLYNDIHIIAYFYKWGEEEILRLSSRKRQKYISLIEEQVKAENGGEEH
jgi:hypothetical protein